MKNKIKEAKEKFVKELANIYGKEEFGLTQEQIDNYFNSDNSHNYAFPELTVREELFYIANPNKNYQDFYKYKEMRKKTLN